MFLLLLLYYIHLADAFCTDIALWIPEKDDTIDMAASALNLKNYDEFKQLNLGLDPDSIRAGKTYTVPFTELNPPATWVEMSSCTPLLKLSVKAASTSVDISSKSTALPMSTVETTQKEKTSTKPNSSETGKKSVPKASSAKMETTFSTTITVKTSKYSLVSSQPHNSDHTASQSSKLQETTSTSTLTETSKTSPSQTGITSQSKPPETSSTEAENKTSKTKLQSSTLTTKTSTSKASSTTALVCNPYSTPITDAKSYNTDEKTLKKYAETFCGEVEGKSLSSGESVQFIYGKAKAMYVFTISWIPECEGKAQSITGKGNLCYNTMIQNWSGCKGNGGLGGYTSYECITWGYRPNNLVT